MSDAGADWPRISSSIREGWRHLARRAAEVLRTGVVSRQGEPVPDDHLIIAATVVLGRHAGKPTNRRADDITRQIIARDWLAQLRLSGYQITFGSGTGHHSTPAGTADKPITEVRGDA